MFTWLIEENVFSDSNHEDTTPKLKEVLESFGDNVVYISPYIIWDSKYSKVLDTLTEKGLFIGSVQVAKLLQKTKRSNYVWCDWKSLECFDYYKHYGNELLNKNHKFIKFGNIPKYITELYDSLGDNDCLFFRPSSGYKTFSGEIVHRSEIGKAFERFKFYQPNDDDIIVVATPQNIEKEYRCFVIDGEIISSSLYKVRGYLKQKLVTDSFLLTKLQELVSIYQPQEMVVIDIAKLKNDEYKILELNSFSCSGHYDCDLEKIFSKTKEKILQC